MLVAVTYGRAVRNSEYNADYVGKLAESNRARLPSFSAFCCQ